MEDGQKTTQQLVAELAKMHQRVAELEELKTERKRMEETLRESEAKYSALVENSRDGIVILQDGVVKFVNAASLEIVGYTPEELLGIDFLKMVTPEDRETVMKRYADRISGKEVPSIYEIALIRKDGITVPVEVNATFINYEDRPADLVVIRDITERKRMQEQLVRQEKLAVLGELAGGVSHELRNPLGAVKQAAYFLNMALEEPEPEVKETLDILEKEVATSERIISSILSFARPKPPTRRKVDINGVLQEAVSCTSVPENIQLVRQLDKTLPSILADPVQLVQVFGNIILNAIQAMPDGGQLTIKSEVPSPEWVTISFTDTGVGIPQKDLGRLLEPLFTTKAKGIGLGLAVAKTLVVGHGGTIEVQSEVKKGSTFTVRLPIGTREEK